MGKATFWNLIARRYAKNAIADQETYRKKLAITREYLTPESEVLEFGCGTGGTALLHAPFVKHILATDVAAKMITIAQERLRQTDIDNVTFEQADMDYLQAEPSSFDVILGLNILHLLDNVDATLHNINRLLRPEGVFISSTACLAGKYRAVRAIGRVFRLLGLFPHLEAFSENQLIEAHRRAADLLAADATTSAVSTLSLCRGATGPG
jgi:ubiquinone/menaquinone biosynthesis C-methylase UbiE